MIDNDSKPGRRQCWTKKEDGGGHLEPKEEGNSSTPMSERMAARKEDQQQ